MLNVKRIAMIALLLLIIGTAGAIFTYQSFAESEPVMEERTFNEAITDIIVETDNSKIEILPTQDETTKVEFSGDSSKKSRYNFEAVVEDGTLNVKVKGKILQFFNFDFNFKSIVTRVYLPEKTYNSLVAETENGAITAEDITVVEFRGESTNGGIHLKNLDTQSVQLKSENGKMDLIEVAGELRAEVTNGGINLKTETLDHPIDFETVNGKIVIQVNKEPKNVEIDAEVVNGSVDIFGKDNRHTVIGQGDKQIRLQTVNGSIKVEK